MSDIPPEPDPLTLTAGLTSAQVRLLALMAASMRRDVQRRLNPVSDLMRFPAFEESFRTQLLMHHATHEDKLNKKSFEYLFKYACEAAGRTAVINHDPTDAAEDVRVDGTRFSLKTQADSAANRRAIYIQKLMEARWIRDCQSAEQFAEQAVSRIGAHLRGYERILALRAFNADPGKVLYELIEIPKDLLLRITSLTPADFSPRNRYGSSGADVRDERGRAFRLLLDGSVEKVRIFNLQTDRCVLHGEWLIDLPGGAAAARARESQPDSDEE